MMNFLFVDGWMFDFYGVTLLITYGFVPALAIYFWWSRALIINSDKVLYSTSMALAGIFLILISLLIHEFSHAIFAGFFGVEINKVGLIFLGAYVSSSDTSLMVQNSWQSITVFCAGPVGQLLFGVACAKSLDKIYSRKNRLLVWMTSLISIRLAILNLMPISFLDGSKAVYKILFILSGQDQVFYMSIISIMSVMFLVYYGIPSGWLERRYLGD